MTDLAPDLERPPVAVRPGTQELGGKTYMPDPRGRLVPIELVKAEDLLEDQLVRSVMAYADDLSARIVRFRQHTFDDVDALLSVLAEQYGDLRGGAKGNITLMTHDGLMKVQVQVQDLISFGPSLQQARALVNECLTEWSSDSGPELRRIVQDAFATDQAGKVNRNALFSLLRLDIVDDRWKRAMKALRDSIRPEGTKRYVRFYQRANNEAKWEGVKIDAASA